jgi:hypothetical protein
MQSKIRQMVYTTANSRYCHTKPSSKETALSISPTETIAEDESSPDLIELKNLTHADLSMSVVLESCKPFLLSSLALLSMHHTACLARFGALLRVRYTFSQPPSSHTPSVVIFPPSFLIRFSPYHPFSSSLFPQMCFRGVFSIHGLTRHLRPSLSLDLVCERERERGVGLLVEFFLFFFSHPTPGGIG